MRKTVAKIKTEAEAIAKVWKILPHHEAYPLVFRIQWKNGDEDSDVDGDNYKAADLEDLESFFKSVGIETEEIDLSNEPINFEIEREDDSFELEAAKDAVRSLNESDLAEFIAFMNEYKASIK
ncbi:MAG: hypothetical protein IM535_08375 [Pseudanabaena sp. M38BS1SP1A06MG]|nr:hypothetical protein [Pseudanabaena sp. M53BS1SP1A06MG]MCA6592120.1 hypothetical protein [Pseudanabaena sp. M38BS1SP1A06MG]